jgi:Holliday junction resolvase
MRSRGKTDLNQSAIVDELRQQGFSVAVTSSIGNDFPDLVVGRNGLDRLVEVKNSVGGFLTDGQLLFAAAWKGAPIIIARSTEDVIKAFNQRMKGRTYYGGSR